ncbi:glycosyltransferase family 4 protein [bacterium]|jgi:glycosyltransferase involved in cell wall biosynthesis|nr:glycosyltransferase family 4 protein [bacterium]
MKQNSTTNLFYDSSSLIIEIPSTFIVESESAKTGAFLFSYETSLFLLNYPFKQIYIVTDSTVEKVSNFCISNNILSKYEIIKLSDIANLSKENKRLIYFSTEMSCLPFLKYRNHFNLNVPVFACFHSLALKPHYYLLKSFFNELNTLDSVIVASDQSKQAILNFLETQKLGLKFTIKKIPYGINTKIFKPCTQKQKKELRKKHRLPEDAIIWLFLARLDPFTKGNILSFCNTLSNLLKINKNFHILIVGDNVFKPYTEKIQTYFFNNHPNQSRTIINPSRETIPEFYQLADAFTSPSELFETFGLTVVEAMASELPVFISDSGAYQNLITNKKEGLFINTRFNNTLPFSHIFNTTLDSDWSQYLFQSITYESIPFLKTIKKWNTENLIQIFKNMGKNGRKKAVKNFEINTFIDTCLTYMEKHTSQLEISNINNPLKKSNPSQNLQLIRPRKLSSQIGPIDATSIQVDITDYGIKLLNNEIPFLISKTQLKKYPDMNLIITIIKDMSDLDSTKPSLSTISIKCNMDKTDVLGYLLFLQKICVLKIKL